MSLRQCHRPIPPPLRHRAASAPALRRHDNARIPAPDRR